MTEAGKLATNLDYLRRFARAEKTPEGKPILRVTALFCLDGIESHIAKLESLLRRARAVIPDEYEDEIEVRAAINHYLNERV